MPYTDKFGLQYRVQDGRLMRISPGAPYAHHLAMRCCCPPPCCGSGVPNEVDVTLALVDDDTLCVGFPEAANGVHTLTKDETANPGAYCSWSKRWTAGEGDSCAGLAYPCSPDGSVSLWNIAISLNMYTVDDCVSGTWEISVLFSACACISPDWYGTGDFVATFTKDASEDWPLDWEGEYTLDSWSDDGWCDPASDITGTATI